ncbi:acyl carrier protein [Rhizobium sp. S95]|uniref:Acyl carrier protein n=1 Tax=Ciceribacter sichuanensis TaxID=2949647 RepID=A0AAJ1F9Z3_9HYPH|nr:MULTISPECIES: acyl carrier protein [unclassified Ciceribacter]MCM2396608.1 acyl carrier protein [Ciceribacter sp. S95]MCO5959899.1 acyl carrier protein [Ciceribacter sp. S101]
MTKQELEALLSGALRHIAPEVDPREIDRDGDLREEFDIDSIDFLNLIAVLSKRFSLPVPEDDYPRLRSFTGIVDYLAEKVA